ncbi:MAG: hypothetical protein OXH68_15275 [Gammaproteobacteria bacterium]|nr:hypothetical protein [Gammaproteobacteria bacterium]
MVDGPELEKDVDAVEQLLQLLPKHDQLEAKVDKLLEHTSVGKLIPAHKSLAWLVVAATIAAQTLFEVVRGLIGGG